jgi:hypothetical protein
LFGSERGCFILRGILSLGAVDRRDIPGRGMLWVFGGVMLKLAQDVGNVPRHGNVTCAFVVILFQSHAGVHRCRPVGCEFIRSQKGIPEMLCILLANVFNCEIVDNERERDRPSLV